MFKFADLTGNKYGKLAVLGLERKTKQRRYYWKCICDCGNTKITYANVLVNGSVISCGCTKKEKITFKIGDKIGKLTLLQETKVATKSRKRKHWKCICACGNTVIIRQDGLYNTRSCGCSNKPLNGLSSDWKKYIRERLKNPHIRMRYNINRIMNHALNGRKNGKSMFDYLPYTFDQLKERLESQFEPWMSWDNYGGKSNDPRKTWHLDHIIPQSHFNFTSMEDEQFQECWALSNLRPLEKIENIIKGNS